ncbi:CBS domain-containing protein [Enterococcus sp. BWB1-3]|uniref:CBS domain-containing protein n=1 Tax=unclassified Enterococcus TaxID=2608891 RepID=UPI0019248E1C|nr:MULTISPECIES: CBS domain-containing protein [unclassified Enterococcus]MBL1229243.1 CBS domain-containing protein [Enterococcus sp. BWB1-3]MCB5951733.1 CBS domain-containing protein [Enterococcus sp. BWT-B8]MCB5955784.1 CBS domain-containing protein [Enterococcus sp. CWB-B31]
MSIRDFMTKNLIVVQPDVKIFDAVDLMKKNDIHRLPVVKNERLVGLLTEGTIQSAMPSQATSLSVYEVNYLLNKTTVADIMIKDVLTVDPDALLEDGIYQMRVNNIGVLPVVDKNNDLVGIITNNDIFDAFLKITGYNDGGTRIQIRIPEDHKGILARMTELLAENDFSIMTVVVNRKELETIIEMQVESRETEKIQRILTDAGYDVFEVALVTKKNV